MLEAIGEEAAAQLSSFDLLTLAELNQPLAATCVVFVGFVSIALMMLWPNRNKPDGPL